MSTNQLLGILVVVLSVLASGCTTAVQPYETDRAHPGIESEARDDLTALPPPKDKLVAAVYRFRDQTGQYKQKERGSTFSTAVTQGATSILVSALKDSGWFVPIERKGLSNLLNERDIIRSIRAQHSEGSGQLSPLLYAGVMLEGGIIGYDTNVITGGGGLRLLGIGGSVIMKKTRSWYIGPVMGATSARNASPVIQLRTPARATKAAMYVPVMWKRLTFQIVYSPMIQITIIGQRVLPHCVLRGATAKGATKNSAQSPKLDGFQM